jgi:biopolymer transport protein TolQ
MDVTGLGAAVLALAQTAATEIPIPAPEGLASSGSGVDPADFTVWALFLKATITVQIVMIMLVAASFWAWAIIVEKFLAFRKLRASIAEFEERFWSGQSLEELHERIGRSPSGPAERVFAAGMTEWNRSFDASSELIPGTQARIDRAMNVAIARETEVMARRLQFLATVGSVSPFVGLFGTVWGIKVSFEAIALMQSTNLAVVAPGIAEALFSTALGLLAAIPAVMAYNRFAGDVDRLTGSLENFADEFSTILGRQIDRQSAIGPVLATGTR